MNWTKILKAIIFIGAAALLFIPFIVGDGMFFPYITGKAYFFRLITGLIFTAYLLLAILDQEYRPKKSGILFTFLLFTASLFVSNYFGVNPTASFWSNFERMEGWVTIVHLLLLFMALGNTFKKTDWHSIFNISLFFNFWMLIKSFSSIADNGWDYRIDMSLGNSTYLAIYVFFNAFLALYLMFNQFSKKDFSKASIQVFAKKIYTDWAFWIYGIIFILNSVIIFQTQTRGTVLGWFGGLMIIGLTMIFVSKSKASKIISSSALLLVIVSLSSIFLFKNSNFIQNTPALRRIADISITEGTAKARILNWQIAAKGVAERPVLGWGQSNFNYVFDKYYLPEHYGNETWFDRVHNVFFDWLIAGGMVGLFFYLSIWLAMLWGIWKTDEISNLSKSALVALMAGYFVHNLFVFDQIASYLYFILILAFVHSLYSKKCQIVQKPLGEVAQGILLAIVLLAAPNAIWFVNMPSYYANIELLNASRILKNTADGKVGFVYEDGLYHNMGLFQKALERNTFANAEISGRALIQVNTIAKINGIDKQTQSDYIKFSEALMLAEIKRDPENSRNYYLLGNLYLMTGRYDQAEEMLNKAIEISPNKITLREVLVNIYKASDQAEKAINLSLENYNLKSDEYDLWAKHLDVLGKFDQVAFTTEIKKMVENGNYEWSERFMKSKIPDEIDNPQPLVSLAALYVLMGDTAKATSTLYEIIEKFPETKVQTTKIINQIEAGESPLGKSF